MKLVLTSEDNKDNLFTFDIVENNTIIGGLELTVGTTHLFIDNIHLYEQYRGKGFLKHIINAIKEEFDNIPMICLPLPKHVEKFKHLGFSFYNSTGEDNFYILSE